MKYIRTKDDVYCFENNFILKQNKKGEVLIRKPNRSGYFMFNIKDIINQADTIEELCDEFVYKYKNPYYIEAQETYELVKMSLENMKATMEMTSGATFYGAIWTDKGLIYVAKMNENGELELL